MNGNLLCNGVAGYAAEARDVVLSDQLKIRELRFGYMLHLQFICGRTIAQLLSNARLLLDNGEQVMLQGLPQLEIRCRMFEVPYCLHNLVFAVPTEEKRA